MTWDETFAYVHEMTVGNQRGKALYILRAYCNAGHKPPIETEMVDGSLCCTFMAWGYKVCKVFRPHGSESVTETGQHGV